MSSKKIQQNKKNHSISHHFSVSSLFSVVNEKSISGVSVDSRLHQSGQLFFALSGAQTDGHQFLQAIATKGAAGAVVREDYQGPDFGLSLFRVKDPLIALQQLARSVLEHSRVRVVAVTGSVGKTTTKDFLTTLLKEKYRVASSPGNSNSQIGLPLAILNHMQGDEEIIVLEMGMTHPGNLRALIQIAPPECAIITSVELVHACNFNSIEEIARTKAEILESPSLQLGILHRDIVNFEEIAKIGSCPKKSFSYYSSSADLFVHSDTSENLAVNDNGKIQSLGVFPITGKHHRSNFLAAMICAQYFGLTYQEIASGMQKLTLPKQRWEVIVKGEITWINDAYNASPVSVKAALENMPASSKGGRKVAVLADMLELGQFSEQLHREVGEYALNFVDLLFCYGIESRFLLDCWRKFNRPVQWFSERADLVRALQQELRAGDVVLVKGSRSTQISKVLEDYH